MIWNRCKQLSESGHLADEAMEEARQELQGHLVDRETSNCRLEDLKPRWLEQLSCTTGSWQYWEGIVTVASARFATDLSSVLQEITTKPYKLQNELNRKIKFEMYFRKVLSADIL